MMDSIDDDHTIINECHDETENKNYGECSQQQESQPESTEMTTTTTTTPAPSTLSTSSEMPAVDRRRRRLQQKNDAARKRGYGQDHHHLNIHQKYQHHHYWLDSTTLVGILGFLVFVMLLQKGALLFSGWCQRVIFAIESMLWLLCKNENEFK